MSKKHDFSKIYDEHVAKIYRFVYLKVGTQETAEDLSSEVFMRGWSSYDKIRNPKHEIRNISAFLYQIARNVVADYYRKKGRVQVVSIEEMVIASSESLEEQASLSMDIENIQKVLKELPDDYQNLIIWRYIDELSVPEIVEITGKSEGNVRVGIHRALQALKGKIAAD
jgi:RNA polymerase sigma-70 factor (ECF subfamily)